MNLYVDVLGGAAGDMLLAALLDLGAPHEPVAEAISAVLGRPVELATSEVTRKGLRALALALPKDLEAPVDRGPLDLVVAVDGAPIRDGVRARATAVLSRLGAAEAHVHGVSVSEVHLEELAADDTLVDVVGVAAALDALGVDAIHVSPLPVLPAGGGSPAPATLELLRGFVLRPQAAADLPEPVTPTAAAIFAALAKPASDLPELRLDSIGVGAGTNDPASIPNVVRVIAGTSPEPVRGGRRLVVVEANVDDLSPELVPEATTAMFAAGALDAWSTPIVMKQGRPALTVSAICELEALADVRRAFFESTSTLGVRIHGIVRPELERRVAEIELANDGPTVRVKLGILDGRVVSAKPEHADVVEAARKLERPVRAVHETATAVAQRLLEEER